MIVVFGLLLVRPESGFNDEFLSLESDVHLRMINRKNFVVRFTSFTSFFEKHKELNMTTLESGRKHFKSSLCVSLLTIIAKWIQNKIKLVIASVAIKIQWDAHWFKLWIDRTHWILHSRPNYTLKSFERINNETKYIYITHT